MRRIAISLLMGLLAAAPLWGDDVQELRDSVNRPWSPSPPSESAPPKRRNDPPSSTDNHDGWHEEDDGNSISMELLGAAAIATGYVVATPVWAPATLVDDGQQARCRSCGCWHASRSE